MKVFLLILFSVCLKSSHGYIYPLCTEPIISMYIALSRINNYLNFSGETDDISSLDATDKKCNFFKLPSFPIISESEIEANDTEVVRKMPQTISEVFLQQGYRILQIFLPLITLYEEGLSPLLRQIGYGLSVTCNTIGEYLPKSNIYFMPLIREKKVLTILFHTKLVIISFNFSLKVIVDSISYSS